jgi:2-phosphoglycerate kinase
VSSSVAPLVVVGPDGRRPFMRGILVQSLVSRGVPFDLALDTATRIRDRIAESGEVDRTDLAKLIQEFLGDRELDAVPMREVRTPMVLDARGSATPFSKGILAASLQGAGMEPSDAYDVAGEMERRLLRSASRDVDRTDLRGMVAETIERKHGERAAKRYRVWRRAAEEGRPIFLLVGGSTGSGKTSIAVEVARRLDIARVMGTDSIRQIMRLMFSADLMPEIHCSTYEAYRVLKPEALGARDPIVAGFREQAQKIAVGVHALLDRALEENASILIEGVNMLPGVVDLTRYRSRAHVIDLVVATLDVESYRNRFTARARSERARNAERYLEHFDAIWAIQNYILHEAEQCGTAIVDNVGFDAAVLTVTRSVIGTLEKNLAQEAATAP